MSFLQYFFRDSRSSNRRSLLSDVDLAQRTSLALGAVLIGVLIAGLWLVVRGLA